MSKGFRKGKDHCPYPAYPAILVTYSPAHKKVSLLGGEPWRMKEDYVLLGKDIPCDLKFHFLPKLRVFLGRQK